jgi:DNA-binding transcriptional regulator YiaG
VAEPTFLTQAVFSNALGRPTVAHWGAVTGLPRQPRVGELAEAVADAGLAERATNPGGVRAWIDSLAPLVSPAIDAATADLRERRAQTEEELADRLERERRRLQRWEQRALDLAERPGASRKRRAAVVATRDETAELIDSLAAAGTPFVRLVGVLVPAA